MTKVIPPSQISSGLSSFIVLILHLPFGYRISQIIHLTLLCTRLVPSSFHNEHSHHRKFIVFTVQIVCFLKFRTIFVCLFVCFTALFLHSFLSMVVQIYAMHNVEDQVFAV